MTGIGPKRAARIIIGWAAQKVIRKIMLFLHASGVGTSHALRIYKAAGVAYTRLNSPIALYVTGTPLTASSA